MAGAHANQRIGPGSGGVGRETLFRRITDRAAQHCEKEAGAKDGVRRQESRSSQWFRSGAPAQNGLHAARPGTKMLIANPWVRSFQLELAEEKIRIEDFRRQDTTYDDIMLFSPR